MRRRSIRDTKPEKAIIWDIKALVQFREARASHLSPFHGDIFWGDITHERAFGSGLAVGSLAPFVAFLGLYRKGCDRPCIEPLQADRFAGFFAIAIGAIVEPGQSRVDLCDQLALPVARP
jgi:hypothetical protein